MKRIIYLICATLASAALLMFGFYVYNKGKVQELDVSVDLFQTYGRHYLFVSSDESSMLQEIYNEMARECEETGAYLEWCGKGAPDQYNDAECIDISIAMDADGIIVYPDGSSQLTEAIARASERNIPVITILRDLPDSERVSYVGVSNYQMGELYGGRLLSLMNTGENDVCLLIDSGDSESESQLVFAQMVQAVKNGAPSGKTMNLRTESVDSRMDFDAEEVIRDILLQKERPDILICLNSVQTECAIQALIDYNLVGDVQVIGYYVTDTILQALRQDLIPVTMTIDSRALGSDVVQALDEYHELGRVSSYYNISLSSITPTTVESYISSRTQQDLSGEEEE